MLIEATSEMPSDFRYVDLHPPLSVNMNTGVLPMLSPREASVLNDHKSTLHSLSAECSNTDSRSFLGAIAESRLLFLRLTFTKGDRGVAVLKTFHFESQDGRKFQISMEGFESYLDSFDSYRKRTRIRHPSFLSELFNTITSIEFDNCSLKVATESLGDIEDIDSMAVSIDDSNGLDTGEYFPFFYFYVDCLCFNHEGLVAFYFHESGEMVPAGQIDDWVPRILSSLKAGDTLRFEKAEPWDGMRSRTCESCDGSGKCHCVRFDYEDKCTRCHPKGACPTCAGGGVIV